MPPTEGSCRLSDRNFPRFFPSVFSDIQGDSLPDLDSLILLSVPIKASLGLGLWHSFENTFPKCWHSVRRNLPSPLSPLSFSALPSVCLASFGRLSLLFWLLSWETELGSLVSLSNTLHSVFWGRISHWIQNFPVSTRLLGKQSHTITLSPWYPVQMHATMLFT